MAIVVPGAQALLEGLGVFGRRGQAKDHNTRHSPLLGVGEERHAARQRCCHDRDTARRQQEAAAVHAAR